MHLPNIEQSSLQMDSHGTAVPSRLSALHLEVDVEQLLPLIFARQRDVDALLQASAQRLINVPWEVGGGQHHHMLPLFTLAAVVAAIDLYTHEI